jgi:hypothetical protein
VVVFLLVPISTLQVGIVCVISKMDNSLHPSSERKRFKVMKFPNKTSRLIHQMWDEMVTMIVIKKDNIMEIISKMAQTNVEGSYVITVPKKQKKGGDNGGEKGEDN